MLASIAFLLPAWGWLSISVVFYAVGEYISKTWANSPTTLEVVCVVAASALSALFWLPALFSHNHLAIMGVSWLLLATASTVLIGVVVFGEKLTVLQWGGIALAVAAFVLLTATYE
jgi:multidrug transporter EmrE-like cation transporter